MTAATPRADFQAIAREVVNRVRTCHIDGQCPLCDGDVRKLVNAAMRMADVHADMEIDALLTDPEKLAGRQRLAVAVKEIAGRPQ